jgi:signal transduction histidine kinase
MPRLLHRLWPRSLMGQVLLAVALALLAAQAVSAALLYRASEARREAALLHVAAFRLVVDPDHVHGAHGAAVSTMRGPGRPRGMRVETVTGYPLLPGEARNAGLEKSLRTILADEDPTISQVLVTERNAARDPVLGQRLGARHARLLRSGNRTLLVAAVRRGAGPEWSVVRVLVPRHEPGALGTLLLQTLLLYLLLVGILAVLLRRITRPLAALTGRVERFARRQDTDGQMTPEGPDDVRRLIAAHNAMEGRIAALLDEKDVMLGAIGHDLKTPLAALRVRIESVEDDAERGKMAATIEDIVRSLDDILSLARVGRASEPPERTELAALASSVVEEFEDMGEPVTLAEGQRVVAPVQVTWAKRALRNLVSNAVRYGGGATVEVVREGAQAVLRVTDSGPGIPAGSLTAMTEPFTRGEASRNRGTGGAGLGLTLARAIAEAHGGSLVLANRAEGGLSAELRLPL